MILIIDRSKKNRDTLGDIFRYMGILAYACSPKEATAELSAQYHAIIIANPTSLVDIADFTYRLRSYASHVPLFSLSETSLPESYEKLFAINFKNTSNSSEIARAIIEYCKLSGKYVIGKYLLAGIDASADREIPLYFDTPLPFTKTETMILRYLTVAYPTPKDAGKILKYAFKERRSPEVCGVRTHISVMNRKFREIYGRNLISNTLGEGYSILTAERMSEAREREVLKI